MSLTKEIVMILFIPANWVEFNPHFVSMMALTQDNGFGEIYESPLDSCEQVCAFIGKPLYYNDAMIYLEH